MKKRLAVLVLVLAPLAASAQGGPPPVPMAVQRQPNAGAPAGITVSGSTRVATPVKTVRFIAYVRGAADEAGALAAMRAAGIEEPSIGPPGNSFSFGNQQNGGTTVLRGLVRNVTPERLIAIGHAAETYVRAHPGSSVDSVQFFTHLDDCAAVEGRARTGAFAETRRRAEAIAAAAGVAVDGVLDVAEGGGCTNVADGNEVPIDVGSLSAYVYITERVTYGIAPAAASTRRRPL